MTVNTQPISPLRHPNTNNCKFFQEKWSILSTVFRQVHEINLFFQNFDCYCLARRRFNEKRLIMSDTSNNKRFGSAEEIQASDRKSKCSCSNAMFCRKFNSKRTGSQITSDRRYKQAWSDRVLCISFILSTVVNLVPRVFSLSNMAAAEEDPGTRLYGGRHYLCPLNESNAGSEERDWMQAFLSPEPVVSWSRGLETSGSGDENGMQVTHVRMPSMCNSNLRIMSVGSSCPPPNCKNQDALVMAPLVSVLTRFNCNFLGVSITALN